MLIAGICLTAALRLAGGRGTTAELTADQKVEDFRYLFSMFQENHPYLALKARAEGFDWLAHEDEFEEEVRETADNREFAAVIDRIVALVNNAHTRVASGATIEAWRRAEKPISMYLWRYVSRNVANHWYKLARQGSSYLSRVPFQAIYFDGDYVVTEIKDGHDLGFEPGCLVTGINGTPVHEFVAALRGSASLFYDPVNRRVFLQTLEFPASPLGWLITLKTPDGLEIEAEVPVLEERWIPQSNWFPPRYRYMGEDFAGSKVMGYTAFLEDGKVGYVHIKSMGPTDSSDMRRLLSFFRSVKDTRALIIDVRGNRGGAKSFWTTMVSYLVSQPVTYSYAVALRTGDHIPNFAGDFRPVNKDSFLHGLAPEEKACLPPELLTPDFQGPVVITETIKPSSSSVNYAGKIFLLVDHRVYSAAEWLSLFCKTTGWATLVGTPTGGDGLGLTSAIPIVLPNSGMVVLFPSGMGLNPDWSANEESHTIPDVVVDLSDSFIKWVTGSPGREFESLDPGYDPVLKECLELISCLP